MHFCLCVDLPGGSVPARSRQCPVLHKRVPQVQGGHQTTVDCRRHVVCGLRQVKRHQGQQMFV